MISWRRFGWWVALALTVLVVLGCKKPAETQTHTYTLTIARGGETLGTLVIPPGQAGDLTLSASNAEAQELEKLWLDARKAGEVSAKMHKQTASGQRGAYGTATYRVGTPAWPEGVYIMLLDKSYQVQPRPAFPSK